MLYDSEIFLFLYLGRAGRYGSKFPIGEVTCINGDDLPLLHSSLKSASPTIEVIFYLVINDSMQSIGLVLFFQII